MLEIESTRDYMRDAGVDAWLVYDFRGSNPVLWQLLGGSRATTRRSFLLLPARGEAMIIAHAIEKEIFSDLEVKVESYAGRGEMLDRVREGLQGCSRVAMEYSPRGELPVLSWVDGGTLELIRSLGVEVVSSAPLSQVALTLWCEASLESHLDACRQVGEVKDAAFDHIREGLKEGPSLTEYDVREFILSEFRRRRLETDHPPIVGTNANSGNPHYEPMEGKSARIARGDWVLIDLWARRPGERNVFGDITWVGYAGAEVPETHQRIFDLVAQARDKVVERLRRDWGAGRTPRGWELDRVARDHIAAAGFGAHFPHRTGHSLGPGPKVHALGVNLDDLETHDTREVLPRTGFSVEPGIYLAEFGVRLEINVYVDGRSGPTVTTPVQDEVVKLV